VNADTIERSSAARVAARILRETAWDVGVGVFWAALIVAIVLFSGVATQFVYVNF
jgi:predicted TIM-barrel enzyme